MCAKVFAFGERHTHYYTILLGRTSFGLRINRYQKYPNRNDGREPIILVPINEHRAGTGLCSRVNRLKVCYVSNYIMPTYAA